MNRKSLLPPGLYRICVTLPGHVRRLAAIGVSKRHTSWAALALLLSFPALADVADTLLGVKPAVVGVGTFNPTGSPRANLQGTDRKSVV